MEKALATMPAREKREVAEWLLSQIEDQIPKDFFVGLQQVREGRRLNEEGRLWGQGFRSNSSLGSLTDSTVGLLFLCEYD